MNSTEKSRVKNAPLASTEDRSDFLAWAMSFPDGSVGAGWQPMHPHLDGQPDQVLRNSGAKLVSLTRRELNHTVEEVATAAGVPVAEVVALEHGDGVSGQTVERVAGVLQLDAEVLVQLFGLIPMRDSQLVEAATEFVVHLEPVEPLQPREAQALGRFRTAVLGQSGRKQVE